MTTRLAAGGTWLLLPLFLAALGGCGGGGSGSNATTPAATTGPTGGHGQLAGRAGRHAGRPGPGSGTIIRSTKPSKAGVIVVRGSAGTHTYGPFTRKGGSYAVSAEQPAAGSLGIAAEPMAVSSSTKMLLQLAGMRGQAVTSIPWSTFYLWIPRAPSSYLVTLTPHG